MSWELGQLGLTMEDQWLSIDNIAAYLGIAYEFDPYFGLSISRVDPLPRQLEAVYDYLLKLSQVREDETPYGEDG